MSFWIVALLIAGAAMGNALIIWAVRKGQTYEADVKALASEKGWQFEKVNATGRTQGYLGLSAPDERRALLIYSGGGRGQASATVWTSDTLAIPAGLAVYAAPLPEKTQFMINMMMDKSGSLGRVLLDSVFKGLGPEASHLRTIDDDDPATLMATPGAEHAFDPLKHAPELSRLNQFGSNIADVPFLVRGTDGLSMRINKRLKSINEIREFIDVAETLSRKFQT